MCGQMEILLRLQSSMGVRRLPCNRRRAAKHREKAGASGPPQLIIDDRWGQVSTYSAAQLRLLTPLFYHLYSFWSHRFQSRSCGSFSPSIFPKRVRRGTSDLCYELLFVVLHDYNILYSAFRVILQMNVAFWLISIDVPLKQTFCRRTLRLLRAPTTAQWHQTAEAEVRLVWKRNGFLKGVLKYSLMQSWKFLSNHLYLCLRLCGAQDRG